MMGQYTSKMVNKQLILVAVHGEHTQVVHGEASPAIIGMKRGIMMRSGNWIGWRLQIRTVLGYKNVPILNAKAKKKPNPYD